MSGPCPVQLSLPSSWVLGAGLGLLGLRGLGLRGLGASGLLNYRARFQGLGS